MNTAIHQSSLLSPILSENERNSPLRNESFCSKVSSVGLKILKCITVAFKNILCIPIAICAIVIASALYVVIKICQLVWDIFKEAKDIFLYLSGRQLPDTPGVLACLLSAVFSARKKDQEVQRFNFIFD
jgi:hypothetical protein